MDIGVFIPIGRNGWIVLDPPRRNTIRASSSTSETTLNAERYGFDFALSMIKLRGFGGESGFWDQNLQILHPLMAEPRRQLDLAPSSSTPPCRRSPFAPAIAARMAVTIDSILQPAASGSSIITGWQRRIREWAEAWPGARRSTSPGATTSPPKIYADHAGAVDDRRLQLPGASSSRWRTTASSPAAGADQADLGRPERRRHEVHRQVRRLQLRVRHGLQHADRLRAHRRPPAEGRRQQRPPRRDLRPVHDHHRQGPTPRPRPSGISTRAAPTTRR